MFHSPGGVQWFRVSGFIAQALIYHLLELLDDSIVFSLVFEEELLKPQICPFYVGKSTRVIIG